MALRIAFDMDGVFADMSSALHRECVALFGEPVKQSTADPPEQDPERGELDDDRNAEAVVSFQLTTRQQRQLWRQVATIDGFWESLEEIEKGSVSKLARIAGERHWEVIFLTKRPRSAGATAQVQTQRWLSRCGFTMPSVYVVQGSRGAIAAALDLDFVVDDRPENCLDVVADSRARAVLVWRDKPEIIPAAARRMNIGVVSSVSECLDVLVDADAASERPGIVERFMRRMGLKSAAGR
jgi:5' nucleotidase, deoxy (Pyrimidine), cytosolic type C protein (NT5C)